MPDDVGAIAARIAARDRGGPRGPWTLELYPTLVCNLDCGFCDTTDRHRPPVDELSDPRLLALVDEAAALGARKLMVLGGGEPLVRPVTLELMRRAKGHGLEGMLTTNGTLLGPRAREALTAMGWDEVHVSVDGARPTTHDALRGQVGAFARTIRNTCALRALPGAPRLALHTVVTEANVDELDGIVRLAVALGASRVDFDDLVAYRPEQTRLVVRDRDRLRTNAAAALDLAERHQLATTLPRFAAGLPARGSAPPEPGTGSGYARAACLKPWHHLVVQADGRIAPCCVLSGLGESVRESSLAELWEGSAVLAGVRSGHLAGRPPGRCAECSDNILVHERNIRAALPA